MRVFYFGCVGIAGHYMHDAALRHVWESGPPWAVGRGEVDAKLAPHRPDCKMRSYCPCTGDEQGRAAIHHKDGWTALAFWDRTGDARNGSNSVFFAEGTHDFGGMVVIASEKFPTIVRRFKFALTEHEETPNVKSTAPLLHNLPD